MTAGEGAPAGPDGDTDDGDAAPSAPAWLPQRVPRALRGLLIAYAVCLAVVGGIDLFTATGFDGRMTGGLVAVACVQIAVGTSGGFWPFGRLRRLMAIMAEALALFLGFWLVVTIRTGWTVQPRLVVTMVIILLASAAAAVLQVWDLWTAYLQRGRIKERLLGLSRPADPSRATLIGGALAAVSALFAAGLALPQFWYSARYQPSTALPVVSIDASVDQVRERHERLEITASITLENSGKVGVRVLASIYEITGTETVTLDAGSGDPLDPDRWHAAVEGNDGPSARYNAYTSYRLPELIQFGPLTWESAWLEPGEKTRATVVAFAPKGRFDLLRLTTDVAAAPVDRLPVGDGYRRVLAPEQCGGADVVETRWPLVQRSGLEWLTTSDQELVTAWVRTGPIVDESLWWPHYPGLAVQLQHHGKPCAHIFDQGDTGLEDRANVSWSGSVTDAVPPGK